MRDRSHATTATDFPAGKPAAREGSRLVGAAPAPEPPDVRDKAGAQKGMVIMLVGGGLFWFGVAAVVAYLLR